MLGARTFHRRDSADVLRRNWSWTATGDSFGKVLSWLWRSGRHHKAVVLAADFLSEMRQHNPYAPEAGQRLTWADLRIGIGQAVNTPYDLSAEELNELCDHLETNIPSYYGTSLAELNTA